MSKNIVIVGLSLLLVASPAIGQTPQATAAGTEFYFTLFDFYNVDEQNTINHSMGCGIGLKAIEDAKITFSAELMNTGYTHHMNKGAASVTSLQTVADAVLKCVHVQSTGACFLNIWVTGSTGSAASVILPKHMLGTRYMLQGVPGAIIASGGVQRTCYSQFTIIGTADGTTVRITPRIGLICCTSPYAGKTLTAGQIRTRTIWKDGTVFCRAEYLRYNLTQIEAMPQSTFDEIVSKYVEMNVAHPFMEGNGRSTRIWLDMIFKHSLKQCVDWSKIDKKDYLQAMRLSMTDDSAIRNLLRGALTDRIDDREIFMKGIDYSYYYEQAE